MTGAEIIRTAIFGVRNVKKTQEGHVGRGAVALGQAKNVFDAVKSLDCGLAKSAQSASAVFHSACQKDILVNGFYNVADKCARNINPLIWASAGLDVIFSDNPKETLVENVAAVGTMRVTEEIMKRCLDKNVDKLLNAAKNTSVIKKLANSNLVKGISKRIMSSDSKLLKLVTRGGLPAFIKGTLFVVGSCLAYDAGKKFADNVLLGKNSEKTKPDNETVSVENSPSFGKGISNNTFLKNTSFLS